MTAPRYSGASGIREAAEARMRDNSGQWLLRHAETGLRLLVEPNGTASFVDGCRNDATGFPSLAAAQEAGERFGLRNNGFLIEQPTKKEP